MKHRIARAREYERQAAVRAIIATAAGRLRPIVAFAVESLVKDGSHVRMRRHGASEVKGNLLAPIFDECRALFAAGNRVGDIAEGLAQAMDDLREANGRGIPAAMPEDPKAVLDALSIMEMEDALLALALLLVGDDPRQDLGPSYFGRGLFEGVDISGPYARVARPAIETAVGLGKPGEPVVHHPQQAA